jgi:molybdate transport system substrate-binding protein
MTKAGFVLAISGLLLVAYDRSLAQAAELKVFCPIAMKGVMAELLPQFERSSAQKMMIEYGTVGALVDRVSKGESGDVAIVSGPRLDELQKQGKIIVGSRIDIARVGIGVFVRAGAAKPDVATVDAFTRTLQSAKAISYGDPARGGVSGTHMASLLERLGLATELKAKTKLLPDSQAVLNAVAKGDADLGIGLTSDATLVPGVDLVGALPAEIQNFTLYSAGVVANSRDASAGTALIKFLASPAAHAVLRKNGFESR